MLIISSRSMEKIMTPHNTPIGIADNIVAVASWTAVPNANPANAAIKIIVKPSVAYFICSRRLHLPSVVESTPAHQFRKAFGGFVLIVAPASNIWVDLL